MDTKNITSTETQETEGQETSKTYTEQEVQELLQRESDRRVSEALKKQERKNAEKMREAQKLAQMNEAEKFQYELDQREAAIAAKERELAIAENKVEASKILAEKGLPVSLVDLVVMEDADMTAEKIKILETSFNNAIKEAVQKRLGAQPPRQTVPIDTPMDKKTFLKLSTMELARLAQDNPELYEQLSNS